MSVHYKFKSSKNQFDTIQFDGLFISLGDLKTNIIQQKKLGKSNDFDLQVINSQTNEVYTNDNELVPKNTSVIVRRVPVSNPGPNPELKLRTLPTSVINVTPDVVKPSTMNYNAYKKEGFDEEENINSLVNEQDEKMSMIDDSSYGSVIPSDYVCYRCGIPGHRIQFCPTNGNPKYDMAARVKKPTGIPKSFLKKIPADQANQPGAAVLAVMTPDEDLFTTAARGIVQSSNGIPENLQCPLCRKLLRDAVRVTCCGKNFCEDCIESSKDVMTDSVACPICKRSAKLVPNRPLRESVEEYKQEHPDHGKGDSKSSRDKRDSRRSSRDRRSKDSRRSRERRRSHSRDRRDSRRSRSRDKRDSRRSRERRRSHSRDRRDSRRSRSRDKRDSRRERRSHSRDKRNSRDNRDSRRSRSRDNRRRSSRSRDGRKDERTRQPKYKFSSSKQRTPSPDKRDSDRDPRYEKSSSSRRSRERDSRASDSSKRKRTDEGLKDRRDSKRVRI